MKYKATLGTTSIIITLVISLLLGCFIAFLTYRAIVTTEIAEFIIAITVAIFILILYLITYLYRPSYYLLDKNSIIIKRPVKDVKISLDEVKDAFKIKKESMAGTERVGGNGGLFGFYGNFKNSFGLMTWYATKTKNYIMIETMNNDKFIITPDNTDMVKEIRKLIGK